ncbi:hypothetical protein MMC25_003585 [Agyrium rufum]|nr:hypothetical protein [Agyrium rufum]
MPRVAQAPRAQHGQVSPTKNQSPIKIPLNDDRHEKAMRLQSRQALHDLQLNQIKAAASPMRKVTLTMMTGSPRTPQAYGGYDKENEDFGAGLGSMGSTAMTPMKRMPILANFEEWMKMATDNKINAANSWNFALIDYFHDMSLLKEGDGVNFQKASCTLDGCVKIYTSRVDSVATETGKLLSGLADSGNSKKSKGDETEEGEGEERDEEGEDGETGPKKRVKKGRSAESTLAPSFASLQLKKFELEFAVDPLFKKASADFDEGGAKGLLLNHLSIDSNGRIVFDSSDDTEEPSEQPILHDADSAEKPEVTESTAVNANREESKVEDEGEEINLSSLRQKFFPDLDRLDTQDICPSLKDFDLGNPGKLSDIPFLKVPEELQQEENNIDFPQLGDRSGIFLDDNAAGFDDDDDALIGFDIPENAGFGEGGEVWAQQATLESRRHLGNPPLDSMSPSGDDVAEGVEVGGFQNQNADYGIALRHGMDVDGHEGILKYFDNVLQKNWAGPEHWRIRRIKDTQRPSVAPVKRKEKEPFEIDFASALDPALAELIYTPASSNSSISIPKAQRSSKTRNLLPDDKHFNSRQLIRLFLKPRARIGSRKPISGARTTDKSTRDIIPEGEMDEAFWAQQDVVASRDNDQQESGPQGNYDANFFQDDGLPFTGGPQDDDDDQFADAREMLSPDVEEAPLADSGNIDGTVDPSQNGPFGSQLVTQNRRVRPEYVQYARVAKKVDVRRLKEEIWKGIGFQNDPNPSAAKLATPPPETEAEREPEPLKFTSVMNSLQQSYPKQAMADISTSFCFICLLHLANEKGLTLNNEDGFEDLGIKRDLTAEITDA